MSYAESADAQTIKTVAQPQASSASLATRLSAWYFGLSFVLIILSSGILYAGMLSSLRSMDDQILEKRMLTLRSLLQESDTNEGWVGHEVSEDLEGPRRVFVRIISDVERLDMETPGVHSALRDQSFADVIASPLDTMHKETIHLDDGQSFRVLTVRVPLAEGWGSPEAILQHAIDRSLDEVVLERIRQILAALLVIAAIVCWVAARYIVKRELRPLREITSATSKIGTETLNYRLTRTGLPAELEELAGQFNDMLARLEAAYKSLRQYADNIAHELRSPVNKMLLGCEVTHSKARSIEEHREALESNIEECNQLSRIVQSVLFLARSDNAPATIEGEPIKVAHELEIIRDYFDTSADEAGLTLSVDCAGDLRTNADRVLFQRAIINLVANSIAHTPRGGSVWIRAANRNSSVAIEVGDTGEGIAPEHQQHIFDRFYRADRARSADDGRLGLGLSITESIVKLHGGTVSLKSEIGRGTVITLTLPASASHGAEMN